ncbi:MAG: CHRD domain-containing protein [Nitrososphaerota archaeon]
MNKSKLISNFDKIMRFYKPKIDIKDTLLVRSILFPLMIIAMVTLSWTIYYNSAEAVQVDRYWSVLEAYDQSSPNTYAHGFIGVKFREDFKQLVYNVNVNNIDNITGIYLYSRGNGNEEPRIIFDLLHEAKEVRVKDKFEEASVLINKKHEVEGSVAVGGITSDDLQGELKGKSLRDLHKLMLDGGTFITIITKEFPKGEIGGGEFVPIDRFFPDMSDFEWNS